MPTILHTYLQSFKLMVYRYVQGMWICNRLFPALHAL